MYKCATENIGEGGQSALEEELTGKVAALKAGDSFDLSLSPLSHTLSHSSPLTPSPYLLHGRPRDSERERDSERSRSRSRERSAALPEYSRFLFLRPSIGLR